LLASLSGVGIAKAADPDEETTTSFQVQPGGKLRFDADVGNVNIITRDTSTVGITLKRRVKAKDPAEVDRLLEKLSIGRVQNGNEIRVTVRVEDDKARRNRNRIELDFDITMPREFNVALETGGSVSMGEIRGQVDAATSGGSLKLGDVSGAVTASSSGGSLQVGDVGAPLNARSSGGSIKAGRIAGSVVAHASGGSVLIAEARDSIDASAAGGSVAAARPFSRTHHGSCLGGSGDRSSQGSLEPAARASMQSPQPGARVPAPRRCTRWRCGRRVHRCQQIRPRGPVPRLESERDPLH